VLDNIDADLGRVAAPGVLVRDDFNLIALRPLGVDVAKDAPDFDRLASRDLTAPPESSAF